MIKHLEKKEDFEPMINSSKILVDFYAEWCGPCKMLSPILDKVSKEMNLDTYKVNVDEVEDVARQYGIMSIPTVMIFEKGKMTKKNVGFMDDAELREFVK